MAVPLQACDFCSWISSSSHNSQASPPSQGETATYESFFKGFQNDAIRNTVSNLAVTRTVLVENFTILREGRMVVQQWTVSLTHMSARCRKRWLRTRVSAINVYVSDDYAAQPCVLDAMSGERVRNSLGLSCRDASRRLLSPFFAHSTGIHSSTLAEDTMLRQILALLLLSSRLNCLDEGKCVFAYLAALQKTSPTQEGL